MNNCIFSLGILDEISNQLTLTGIDNLTVIFEGPEKCTPFCGTQKRDKAQANLSSRIIEAKMFLRDDSLPLIVCFSEMFDLRDQQAQGSFNPIRLPGMTMAKAGQKSLREVAKHREEKNQLNKEN